MFTPATSIITQVITKCHTRHHLQLFLSTATSFGTLADNLLKQAYLIYHNIFIFVSDRSNLGLNYLNHFFIAWQLVRPPSPEFIIMAFAWHCCCCLAFFISSSPFFTFVAWQAWRLAEEKI
jgi:hypothetical protein